MALRLETAIAGTRLRWPGTYGVLLLLVIVMLVESARAEDSDEAYSATVKVDAMADNAAAARELARVDGQKRAL